MLLTLGPTPALQRTMAFDRLTRDAVNRAAQVRQAASGKSINVARVLRTLGHATLATGFLGGDTGRQIRADLDAAAIAHDFVEVAPPTRLCITLVDRSDATATELVEEAAPLPAAAYDALLEKLNALLPRATLLILCGSLPPGAPPDFYRRCLEQASGKQVILDTRGAPLLQALPARPFLVKPNRRELADTFNIDPADESAIQTAMRQLIHRGAQWALVTMGAAGALLTDGRQFWRLHVPTIRPVNPIGSGDAFAAGLAAALSQGQSVSDACPFAAACAAANALSDQAGFLHPADLSSLQSQSHLVSLP